MSSNPQQINAQAQRKYAPPSKGYLFVKRAFDVVSATCGLILLSPTFLVTAIAVKSTSPGPIIFRQQRYGKDLKPFTLYKFRTMTVETDPNVPTRVMRENKSCLTPVGGFLRRNSLDELPQFVNIVKGDIPLRIIKMRPDFPVKSWGAFALPANEKRTGFAAFPQFKSLCSAGLRNLQTDCRYFTAASAQTRQFFAKPIFEGDFAAKAVA